MDDETRKYQIPQRLDDPPKFLWFEFDVAIVAMGTACLGIVVNYPMTFLLLGALVGGAYQKLKSGRHRAYGVHVLYWYLPITLGFKRTPPSAHREFIG